MNEPSPASARGFKVERLNTRLAEADEDAVRMTVIAMIEPIHAADLVREHLFADSDGLELPAAVLARQAYPDVAAAWLSWLG